MTRSEEATTLGTTTHTRDHGSLNVIVKDKLFSRKHDIRSEERDTRNVPHEMIDPVENTEEIWLAGVVEEA